MVGASNWSSEGCGFDPRLGLRNHFLSIELEDRSSASIYPSSYIFSNIMIMVITELFFGSLYLQQGLQLFHIIFSSSGLI